METDLSQWVIKKLNAHNWSMRELGKATGIDQSYISKVLSGNRKAGLDFYVKIAKVFNAVPEMLRVAGLIPSETEEFSLIELLEIARKLSPEERKEILDYAQYRLWKKHRDQGQCNGDMI